MSQQGNGTSSSWSVRNQKRKKEIIFQHRLESPTSAFANSLLKIGSSMEKIKREEKEILMKAKGREMESSVPFIRDKWLKWIFFLIFFSFFAPLFLSPSSSSFPLLQFSLYSASSRVTNTGPRKTQLLTSLFTRLISSFSRFNPRAAAGLD